MVGPLCNDAVFLSDLAKQTARKTRDLVDCSQIGRSRRCAPSLHNALGAS